MSEESTAQPVEQAPKEQPPEKKTKAEEPSVVSVQKEQRQQQRRGRGGRKGKGRPYRSRQEGDEFDSRIIDLARVTRVMAGGKRMRFRACVVVGDKKGRVGAAVMKGGDVQMAVAKATEKAKKHLVRVPLVNGSIPHRIEEKFSSAVVLLKPAQPGTGIIAGGPVRVMMELAGVSNIVAKMKGSPNKLNNVGAVMSAFTHLKVPSRAPKKNSPLPQ